MQRGISARLTGRYAPRMTRHPDRRDAPRPALRHPWVRGSAASWALGATLGVVLGAGLLIATPQMMGKPAEATPASTAPANANENGPADAGKSEGSDATPAGETTGSAGEAQTGAEEAAGNAEAGQTVYTGNCAGCHGANGQGNIGPSLVTADGPKSWTLAQFSTALREGQTPDRELSATMPRFGEAQLSDAQIADLQAYLKTLN
ncbi:hypothetical protein GCM10008960_27660 [Deinococcus sedimenti]|uniref:Cytochrome c domain-containing protein n=2 Tax=Deinococcus sedimenti TaxID=1867090 RepID=A0ABQ2S5D9_9DEIO|nr:hypothetical protein GCM10008960_27660 [Deinococcus sedimenti]